MANNQACCNIPPPRLSFCELIRKVTHLPQYKLTQTWIRKVSLHETGAFQSFCLLWHIAPGLARPGLAPLFIEISLPPWRLGRASPTSHGRARFLLAAVFSLVASESCRQIMPTCDDVFS